MVVVCDGEEWGLFVGITRVTMGERKGAMCDDGLLELMTILRRLYLGGVAMVWWMCGWRCWIVRDGSEDLYIQRCLGAV